MAAIVPDGWTMPDLCIEQVMRTNGTPSKWTAPGARVPSSGSRTNEPAWLMAVQKNFAAVSDLSPGWDGPSSRPVHSLLIYRANRILLDALEGAGADALSPYIVPTTSGSLQMEWHTKHYELEFHLDAKGETSFWLHNRDTGGEINGEGDKAVDLLLRWAKWVAAADDNVDSVQNEATTSAIVFAA